MLLVELLVDFRRVVSSPETTRIEHARGGRGRVVEEVLAVFLAVSVPLDKAHRVRPAQKLHLSSVRLSTLGFKILVDLKQ